MDLKKNPFTLNTFVSIWNKHFNKEQELFQFKFIEGLTFFKKQKPSLYINSGQDLTKGVSYTTNETAATNFKNSAILIYDVPDYFDLKNTQIPNNIKRYSIKQYPGYLAELNRFQNFDEYFLQQFSRKSRAKLNRYQKRLELCFDITYKMYIGEISKSEYDLIFALFKEILEKRFAEKQTTNNNLQKKEWDFYQDVTYPLLLEKKAALFVVYQGKIPIGITLNYLSDAILFHGITSFDIDYSKFHLGKVMLKNLFKWSFENDIKTFDFSKGHFDYKTEWMTKKYDFEYHIFVNQSSLKSKIIGQTIKSFLKLKQYLREKEVNKKLHQLTYKIRGNKSLKSNNRSYSFSEIKQKYTDKELSKVDLQLKENLHLKLIINEFLFLNSEKFSDFKISKIKNTETEYLFKGLNNQKIVRIEL